MKVLMIHNFHRKGSSSGDDQVFKNEVALLEANGNTVIRYAVSNDEFDNAGVIKKAGIMLGMIWSFKHYKAVKQLIKKEKPDIVHVHTFFPLLSPSVLYAVKRSELKLVATLHDTRFICPCATSLRKLKLCNECGDGHYFRMYSYGCFKGSKCQSLIVAIIFKYHRVRRSFYQQIDKYICLNEKQIALLCNIGFDKERLVKKYNFVPNAGVKDDLTWANRLPDRYVVYYGRIGEEKGIRILMEIWDKIQNIPLVVMGSGPMEKEFSAWAEAKKRVYYLGHVEHESCLSVVKNSQFMAFPSICYEGCSMVEIEAESLGIPMVATDLGFSEEAIIEGINGCKIPLGDVEGFVKKIRMLWDDPELCRQMGRYARKNYEEKYLPENNYRQLMEIYENLLNERSNEK